MLTPYPHQQTAILQAISHYQNHDRGKMIMPCGSGKTLTALWIMQYLLAKKVVIAIPNLLLEEQTVAVWIRSIDMTSQKKNILVLGSNKHIERNHAGVTVTTDLEVVCSFLQKHEEYTIFTTYHSSPVLLEASRTLDISFDLAIFDEAHHTAGNDKRFFQALMREDISIKKRLFMTATPKIAAKLNIENKVYSMDNESLYGKEFYKLSVREAINQKIICDYKILSIYAENQDIIKWIIENKVIQTNEIEVSRIKDIATAISIVKSMKKYGLKKVITYHSRIDFAKDFMKSLRFVASKMGFMIEILHINGSITPAEQESIKGRFLEAESAVITNSKLLTEGFDMPSVDAIVFVDNRNSVNDIVQASGRAWRKSEGKKYGYIILPCFIDNEENIIEQGLKRHGEFDKIRKVLASLAGMDNLVADSFFNQGSANYSLPQKETESILLLEKISDIDISNIIEQVTVRVWNNVKSMYLMSYHEAKSWCIEHKIGEFLEAIDLPMSIAWRKFAKGEIENAPSKPSNIPSRPEEIYKEAFEGYRAFTTGKPYFTYQEAKEWNHKNLPEFATFKDFHKLYKLRKLPAEMLSPFTYYQKFAKDKSISAFKKDFVKLADKNQKATYEEMRTWFAENLLPKGVNTVSAFKKYLKNGGEYPKIFYLNPSKSKGFVSFSNLFGKKELPKKYKKWGYEISKKWVQENLVPLGIDTETKYLKYFKGEYPEAPSPPKSLLKKIRSKGYISHDDFFGRIS